MLQKQLSVQYLKKAFMVAGQCKECNRHSEMAMCTEWITRLDRKCERACNHKCRSETCSAKQSTIDATPQGWTPPETQHLAGGLVNS